MSAAKPQKGIPKAAPGEDRSDGRIEVLTHRMNATLAIILGNRTMGCVVPLKDFSKTGVGIYSKVRVDPGTAVRLSVDGIESAPLNGKVVWCGSAAFDPSAPGTHAFRIGIEFTPPDDTARECQITIYRDLAKMCGIAVS